MYQPRTYRAGMLDRRFASFDFSVEESDLDIGYTPVTREKEELLHAAWREVVSLREEIKGCGGVFLSSLVPLSMETTSGCVRKMLDASKRASVGPMAAVAGAIAEEVGTALQTQYALEEIVVENGGDLFLSLRTPLIVKLVAPANPLDGKVAIRLPKGIWGVATSSGKTGPSLSFGKADAVMIVSSDAALSDAYATAFANKVGGEKDVSSVAEEIGTHQDIVGSVILSGERLAFAGDLEVVRL
jgi:ApbE superfamily uncharacterized protein (UPF0280 family)